MYSNFHTHTTFCDGAHTAEEMVASARALGFDTLGFSGHGYTAFDGSFCMADAFSYRKEILRLKEETRDLQIMLGVEEDLYGQVAREDYEYLIGSMHYLKVGDTYHSLDWNYDKLRECVEDAFSGDALAFASAYFETFCDYIETRKPDIIGHFDIITKFDEKHPPLFLGNPDYEKLAVEYARRAAKVGCLFEVNTGAIQRGYRTTPYPSVSILEALRACGARVVLSSDCHSKDALAFGFDRAKEILREVGFDKLYSLSQNGVVEHSI